MMDESRAALVREKVERLRQELAELGLESSFFYRSPGSAKAPVAFLLIGETQGDVEEARNA
ncbi:TPA: hypothetical protein QDA94_004184 [Burkholderia vietnamiensis]|nr:hypothetical protein [Burkholderia cenocepacia]HDR8918775.1 hypothetical protein [Burkholderia vietnamiensis]HDR8976966.1 hypothetical protein [Burkholderia vietnamiensis]HDR9049926.1 hypothetical protein [Burkholderia vietnamiensis]HDR9191196.1 hypothetical protein [Burkholderia vietnamiensis]